MVHIYILKDDQYKNMIPVAILQDDRYKKHTIFPFYRKINMFKSPKNINRSNLQVLN
jgi:hypothetical protein